MKKLLFLAGMALVQFSFAQQGDVGDLIKSLKSANAEQVSGHFDNTVDLTLPGKGEIRNMSKSQAGNALKNFFDENGVKGFEVSSQREAGVTMYITGKMAGKDRNYNITLLLKNKDGRHDIISVRINPSA